VDVLGLITPGLVAAERVGSRAVLTIRLGPGRELDFLPALRDVLRMIMRPLTDADEREFLRESPLTEAIRREMDERDWSLYELHRAVDAARYIVSYTVDAPTPSPAPALDTMSAADVRAFFDEPWPTGTVTVEATDPRWLEHLDDLPPLTPVDDSWLG
jgi:hypothetical protein